MRNVICFLVFGILGLLMNSPANAQTKVELWQKVNEAKSKGLPQTAIEHLGPIYDLALAEGDIADAVRAMCERIVLEGNIQGNKPEEKIIRLEKEISTADNSVKPLLNIVLARWYWHYYNQNSYRFMQRDRTEGMEEKDFTAWDLPKLFNHISNLYTNVLSEEESLKNISIQKLYGFIDGGNQPEKLRPTLFDFFAHEALNFFMADIQSAAKPKNAFEIEASSPALSESDSFINWTPESFDDESANFKALKILQRLISNAKATDNTDALIDNDLIRLSWVKNVAVGDDVSDKYITQLLNIVKNYPNNPYSATALAYAARELVSQNDNVKALKYINQAVENYPQTYGEQLANVIKAQILTKTVSIEAEKIMSPQKSQVKISFRNINKLYFKLVDRPNNTLTRAKNYSPDSVDWKDYPEIISGYPLKKWEITLDPGKEYKTCEQIIDLPELPKGIYYLVASVRSDYSETSNALHVAPIIISELGIFSRKRANNNEVFVINAKSGNPIKDAQVKAYSYDYNRGWELIFNGKTNSDGLYKFGSKNASGFIKVEYGDDMAYMTDYFNVGRTESPGNYSERLHFFTDRAIYRPGQTVYFKGIAYSADTNNNNYKVVENANVSVSLLDPNGQNVTTETFRTNEFGSFSGTFTTPTDRLTGRYSITGRGQSSLTLNSIYGQTAIRVEEYKRPKFKVDLMPPTVEFKLGDDVEMSGTAMAYNGSAIDKGVVKYRVKRKVGYPRWYWWIRDFGTTAEIAHGTTTTDNNGKFVIKFKAVPDRTISESKSPIFSYEVTADVTDGNGETRTKTEVVRIGYTAINLDISAAPEISAKDDFTLKINTTTHNGSPISNSGVFKIARLKQPVAPVRRTYFSGEAAAKSDLSDPRNWSEDRVILTRQFTTDNNGYASCDINALSEGAYRIIAQTKDKYGKEIKSETTVLSIDEQAKKFALKIPFHFKAHNSNLLPGAKFSAVWSTGYETGPAFIEIEHRNKVIKSYWTDSNTNKALIEMPVTEEHRGGFNVRVVQFKDNREYVEVSYVSVPWDIKNLSLKFSHMTSKLEPGKKDTWRIDISGEEAEKNAIEMVAAMYDASLDAYAANSWTTGFGCFYHDYAQIRNQFSNKLYSINQWRNDLNQHPYIGSRSYPALPYNIQNDFYGYGFMRMRGMMYDEASIDRADSFIMQKGIPAPSALVKAKAETSNKSLSFEQEADSEGLAGGLGAKDASTASNSVDDSALDSVTSRTNLNETAFFYPNLIMGDNNTVSIEFTIPEALTTWKFLGFAHGKNLQAGGIIGQTVTQKDLMIEPNPPRFLREGDLLEFSAKITNLSAQTQSGKIRLSLMDSVTDKNLDNDFRLKGTMNFEVPAGESRPVAWRFKVPDMAGVIKYKVVGTSGNLSDGEEGYLSVLSRYIFVTESLPLPINGPATKNFKFDKLVNSAKSDTLKHQGLTVEVTSNPAWYAIQALPYLMEYPHECSEQIFSRLYANSLAAYVANSNPKIRKVFNTWLESERYGGKALFSNLEKNQHLKSVTLLETPWVLDAKSETEQKHKIGLLFEANRLKSETERAYNTLAKMQNNDGGFPWFPGGRSNDYITLHIMSGFGRLRHLGVSVNTDIAIKTLNYLDSWIDEIYKEIIKYPNYKEDISISPITALYLYARSFFIKTHPIAKQHSDAVNFFIEKARQNWLKVPNRISQAHIALALNRLGDKKTPVDIVKSIKERSVTNEELGRFWRENEISFWWYRAEIETQAMMIELFSEITNDENAVEECKIWLIKQKQTQNWKSTKATTDAIYSLVLKGTDLLASDKLVTVSLGGKTVKPENVEAGTGYYQKIYAGSEVMPIMGEIKLTKEDKGVAWGALHWQYLEDMSKVTPHETNLKLKKSIFVKKDTDKGQTISPVTDGKLKVGDLVVVRIQLRTDRDMEYIHMKDSRGSGMEPVSVLSYYRYQDGLAYYEAPKDTATHFYIDYLPKGTYVFEYELRVQHAGKYQTGIAEIQCMYAPEFNSHSESFNLTVSR
ncbi:hypothetical protein EOM81_06210 [bacterium]|nr:hypothetical protein [bacterium]